MPTLVSPLLVAAPAIYAALNVAGMTVLATGGVHNQIPPVRTYPHVRVGDWTLTEARLMNRDGAVIAFNVHAFSKQRSDLTGLTLLSKARELLHHPVTPIVITGWDVVNLRESELVTLDDDEVGGESIGHILSTYELDVLQTLP